MKYKSDALLQDRARSFKLRRRLSEILAPYPEDGNGLCRTGFEILVRYFDRFMQAPTRTHLYEHNFSCGCKAYVEYTQFRRAALVKLGWSCACHCGRKEADQKCKQELEAWVSEVEGRERRHFQFRREGSLMLDLGESNILIFRPGEERDVE